MSNLSIEEARKRIAELEQENKQLREQNDKLGYQNELYYQAFAACFNDPMYMLSDDEIIEKLKKYIKQFSSKGS